MGALRHPDQRIAVLGSRPGLAREMGLLALVATGVCSMIGAAINVIPFAIHRSVPGIGPYVVPAYLFAAIPAILAGCAFAILSSAMPRAGGSYVYASRSLSPYLGFVASFSQWFGLSIGTGVISYVLVFFLRDMATALGLSGVARALDAGPLHLTVSLGFLWTFVGVNLRGIKLYERTLVPLMFLMFALGLIVIVAGFSFDHGDFAAALIAREGRAALPDPSAPAAGFDLGRFLAASVLLFSSFIGFDSIAQAGGEARNPGRSLPLAIGIAVLVVGTFYLLFAAAVYHAVPWEFVAQEVQTRDVTAPGLLGYLLAPAWTVAIVGGAAVALANDLPAVLLAVSRLMFAWAEDGIFPRAVARVHPTWRTPHLALLLSGLTGTVGIVGSHLAGDFFLGVDVLVTSMLVTFLLMCLSVLILPWRNPALARGISVIPSRWVQVPLAAAGAVVLAGFLVVLVAKDLSATRPAWYFHSTWVWLLVMAVASGIFVRERRKLARTGADLRAIFSTLPAE